MTRKRSRDADGVQTDELESPKKEAKIMNVSNQMSDQENQGAQSDRETKTEHVAEEALKKEFEVKISPVISSSKRCVKKKKNNSVVAKSVVSKDGATATTGSASETVEGSLRVSVLKERDTSAKTDHNHQLGLSKDVESLQIPKLSEFEKEKAGATAAVDADRPASIDREVEDLLTEMFSVAQEKGSTTDSDGPRSDGMEVDDLQSEIFLVDQKTDKPAHEGDYDVAMKVDDKSENELSVKCFEVPDEKEDSVGLLLMDLEDTPADLSEQGDKIVLQVEGLNDYVIIPSQSNTKPKKENDNNKIADNVVNGGIKNLENHSTTENTVTADNKKVACNPDEVNIKSKDSLSMETTSGILRHDVEERNDKIKTQATLPITNRSTVHVEDEISCEMCEQKIKMTVEGTDILHSNLILRNEDGTKVSIENINTCYSVRCKNQHLCCFDFEMMVKMKMVPAESSSKHNFVHIEDEIPCKKCCQKINMKLEGIDLLHSNMVLLDEDGNNVTIENIKTTYSVHCKNKHLCNFDFGFIEREELQFEEKIDCWEKLKIFLWNVWKKMEFMVTRVLFE